MTQKLDHFGFKSNTTFQQRYFVCNPWNTWRPNGTVFYYTGNEANVELFVNMTGLMWENAESFNAILVFAEHRFFGESQPFPGQPMPALPDLKFLTTDQALADYASHIEFLRREWNSPASPFIGFGGSYGGMLASWLRIKYPQALAGAIAGSAPIVNFEFMDPPYNPNGFQDAVTFDATAAGGAAAGCADNVRQAWSDMRALAATSAGRATLGEIFQLCSPLGQEADVWDLMNYLTSAFGDMAMSSYPYPSSYLLLGGAGVLPAYPMRVACSSIAGNYSTPTARLEGLMRGILVYYNATGKFQCMNLDGTVNFATQVVDYLWGYLACSTMFMPFGTNGVTDMFWNAPWNSSVAQSQCVASDGIQPQPEWVKIQYGGWGVAHWGSNIVFSNGGLDPWRPGGIQSATAPNITTIIIPDVGHHIDLMFSDPKDTAAIKAARQTELEHMRRWVSQA